MTIQIYILHKKFLFEYYVLASKSKQKQPYLFTLDKEGE